jgi:uncharacterized metal-binding protein
MPDARTHDAITVATGVILAPVGYFILLDQGQSAEAARFETILLVGAHLLSGIMFSPDLDIDSAIDNRWGIFGWIWRPYMWVVPHRSRWLSHGLIVAPLLRLLYFYGMVTLLFIGLTWALGQVNIVVPDYHVQVTTYMLGLMGTHPYEVWAVIIGFITGSAAHTIADWLGD